MKNCGHVRSPYFEGVKRVPLNTVILPPLDPGTVENGAHLLMVNKSKSGINGELVTVSQSQDGTPRIFERSSDNFRIAQLEQNIKFLQDQHQIMLNDLHNEIEVLRNKNRDLQFQMIFNKNEPTSPNTSSTSSSDDEHKIVSSPNQPPFTPSLHVELLEKMIGDLKIQLQDNESRNTYLSAIVDEQKKKLDRFDRDRERAGQAEPELRRKVEEADAIIRRLQQENNILRRESTSTVSPSHYHHRESYHSQRSDSSHQSRDSAHGHFGQSNGHNQNGTYQKGGKGNRRNNSMNYRSNWFPPLHSQNYWQGGGGRGGNHDKRNNCVAENSLPNLSGQHQDRRSGNINHHYSSEASRRNNHNKGIDPS